MLLVLGLARAARLRFAPCLQALALALQSGKLRFGSAAKCSLRPNAAQHKRAKEILLELSSSETDNKHLMEVLEQAAEYGISEASE